MDYKTFSGEGYTGGGIVKKGERTMYCKITVDLHQSHSVEQSACEHIYTDAIFSGAGKYDREAFINAVSMLGASITANISNSRLTIILKSIENNTGTLLKLFETMMQEPTFAGSEIIRIQKQVTNELREHEENAKAVALELFVNQLYAKTDRRYTNTPAEITKTLGLCTNKDLKKLHKAVLSGMWTVTIGSNAEVLKKVTKAIDACKKGTTPVILTGEHSQKAHIQKTILHNIPSKQNIEFSIGGALPLTLHHPDYLPFVFGMNVLGKWGGFTGRLMSTVREKEGLTYGIYAHTQTVEGTEQGYWRIMTFFAPEKSVQGLTSTIREITKIHKSGVTQAEYERFKIILRTQQDMLADSLTASVNSLHGYFCADFNLKEVEEYKNKLMSVTRKEVNNALKIYLDPTMLTISGAGPVANQKKEIQSIS